MNKSVLLDTCFLISLVDDSRENHAKAVEFYKYFIDERIAMILSSIVTSEFCVKQEFTDLPLSNFKMLPFNIPDSYNITSIFGSFFSDNYPQCRVAVKDDYKITSQCSFNKIDYFITEDSKFYKKLSDLRQDGKIKFKPLFLPDGFKTAFNIAPTLF